MMLYLNPHSLIHGHIFLAGLCIAGFIQYLPPPHIALPFHMSTHIQLHLIQPPVPMTLLIILLLLPIPSTLLPPLFLYQPFAWTNLLPTCLHSLTLTPTFPFSFTPFWLNTVSFTLHLLLFILYHLSFMTLILPLYTLTHELLQLIPRLSSFTHAQASFLLTCLGPPDS